MKEFTCSLHTYALSACCVPVTFVRLEMYQLKEIKIPIALLEMMFKRELRGQTIAVIDK